MATECYWLETVVGRYSMYRMKPSLLPDEPPGWYMLPPDSDHPGWYLAERQREAWRLINYRVIADLAGRVRELEDER